MKLMLDSPAVEEALNILRALYRMSPPDTSLASNCIISSGSFQSNKCHMTVAWGTTFKVPCLLLVMKAQGAAGGMLTPDEPPPQTPLAMSEASDLSSPPSPGQLRELEAAWVRSLGLPPSERNRLLGRRMKAATDGDPVAYDMVKQDSKDFMMGRIDGRELYDRFMSVFAWVAVDPEPSATPEQVTGAVSGSDVLQPEPETWFKELAMLIPALPKRLELLSQCQQPAMLPHPNYLAAARTARAEAMAAAAAAAAAAAQQAPSPPLSAVPPPSQAARQAPLPPPPPGQTSEEPSQKRPAAGVSGAQPALTGHQPEDDEEGDEGEGEDLMSPSDDQFEDYEDEAGPDVRELKGWQQLDRRRMAELVQDVLRSQQQEEEHEEQPAASTSGRTAAGALVPAVVLPGLEGIHFNSTVSRPAKALKGKKSGTQAVKGQAPPGAKNVLVWLRQDLRLHDNPALFEAGRLAKLCGGTVTLLFVHSPEEEGDSWRDGVSWRPSGAGLVWQHQALQAFNKDMVARHGPGAAVVMRKGPYLKAIQEVASAVGAWHVFCNRRYEPAAARSDEAVWDVLAAQGYQVHTFNAALLREPWEVKVDMRTWSGHFGTLTPFLKACEKLPRIDPPLKEPKKLPVAQQPVTSLCSTLAPSELGLYSPPQSADGTLVDWGEGIRGAWDISEAGALAALDRFLAVGLGEYERARQFADGRAVARLSPYLRFGQLSPRLVWQRMQDKQAKAVAKTFFRRLIWRDLAYWQLYHWPDMPTEPIRRHYVDVDWDWSDEGRQRLRAWQRGCTGFPLVDAGMRELWGTGWMQQSVRMVCASFLTEYLHVHWVEGARWFHDTLVDADLAINSMMWQNAGKAGLDQWNFVMDPTGKAQDPTGAYIRKWVPELRQLPDAHIHKPWAAPASVLAAAGVRLGDTYPHRIVSGDLEELRQRNVAAIRAARALHVEEWCDTRGYDLVVAPKGSTTHVDGRKVVVFTKAEYRQGLGAGDTAGGSGEDEEQGEADHMGDHVGDMVPPADHTGGRPAGGARKAVAVQALAGRGKWRYGIPGRPKPFHFLWALYRFESM